MTQPIRPLSRNGRLPRNSLTQKSLVLSGCEISVVAVPETVSARKNELKIENGVTMQDHNIPSQWPVSRHRYASYWS